MRGFHNLAKQVGCTGASKLCLPNRLLGDDVPPLSTSRRIAHPVTSVARYAHPSDLHLPWSAWRWFRPQKGGERCMCPRLGATSARCSTALAAALPPPPHGSPPLPSPVLPSPPRRCPPPLRTPRLRPPRRLQRPLHPGVPRVSAVSEKHCAQNILCARSFGNWRGRRPQRFAPNPPSPLGYMLRGVLGRMGPLCLAARMPEGCVHESAPSAPPRFTWQTSQDANFFEKWIVRATSCCNLFFEPDPEATRIRPSSTTGGATYCGGGR